MAKMSPSHLMATLCGSPSHQKHHEEKKHLLVLEGGKVEYVLVPPLKNYSTIDEKAKLCFGDHHRGAWDIQSDRCCHQESGHLHAHIHHGDITEDILLEECLEEECCALPMPWDLPGLYTSISTQDNGHEHREGCGHHQIAHGDHFDWLVPLTDGSFLLSHALMTDDGSSQFIEHGRLVKVGESLGKLKRRPKKLVDLFSYESPKRKGYESLSVTDNEIQIEEKLKNACALFSSPQPSVKEEMVKVDIPANATGFEKTVLNVLGICCPAEAPLVKKILEPLPGVEEVSVNITSRTVTVLHDRLLVTNVQLVKALNEARLDASIHRRGEVKSGHKWPSPWTISCGILLVVAFFQYLYHPLHWVAIGAVAIGIPPITMRSLASLRRLILDINILMLIAVAGAIALGDYLEAASIVFLFTLADWLESRSSEKARAALSSVINLAPQNAVLADSGQSVRVEEVKVGTSIAVKAGEMIPIDGFVISGKCSVDESSLTGEAKPVGKEVGSRVWAGTMNLTGFVTMKTSALSEDSAIARMIRLVEEAQNKRSSTELLIECFAKYYTPVLVLTAAAIAFVPLALHVHNQRHWFYLALVLLVVACPCALVISTPVTTTCGIAQAAHMGLIIKGGSYLEVLGKLKVIAMDKTGTLTEGLFSVSHISAINNTSSIQELLYWIASVEVKSNHPIASSLVSYARLNGIEPSQDVAEFEILPGEGVSAMIDGQHVQIGNARLASRLSWATEPLEEHKRLGATVGWVGINGKNVGVFAIADQLREGALEAVQSLKDMSVKPVILTGDNITAASILQTKLGGLDFNAELLPEDKVRIIHELKADGCTGMIGDGINDAPALAAADVGIAMGVAGSAVAMETADVALMTNDLRKVAEAIRLGRRCRAKIIQNVSLSLITKIIIIVLAAVGYASLWAAVLADVGTCIAVTFNSMLLLRRRHQKNCSSSHCQSHDCQKRKHDHSQCGGHDGHKHENHNGHKHGNHNNHATYENQAEHQCDDHRHNHVKGHNGENQEGQKDYVKVQHSVKCYDHANIVDTQEAGMELDLPTTVLNAQKTRSTCSSPCCKSRFGHQKDNVEHCMKVQHPVKCHDHVNMVDTQGTGLEVDLPATVLNSQKAKNTCSNSCCKNRFGHQKDHVEHGAKVQHSVKCHGHQKDQFEHGAKVQHSVKCHDHANMVDAQGVGMEMNGPKLKTTCSSSCCKNRFKV